LIPRDRFLLHQIPCPREVWRFRRFPPSSVTSGGRPLTSAR